jgi:hypothetical protein
VLVRVGWDRRGFGDRWASNVSALTYLLAKHPELREDRHNLARMCGQIAFACAALRRRREAARWAWRAMRSNVAEPRPYLALLVGFAGVPASLVLRVLRAGGRGI